MKRKLLSILTLFALSTANASQHIHTLDNMVDGVDASTFTTTEAMKVVSTLALYHYPVISFNKMKNHVIEAMLTTENQLNISTGESEQFYQKENVNRSESIEELILATHDFEMNLVEINKKTDIEKVDESLIENLLVFKDDPYTRILPTKKNTNQHETLKPSLSTNSSGNIAISSFNFHHCKLQDGTVSNGVVIDIRNNSGGDIQCTLDALASIFPTGKHLVGKIITNDFEKNLYVYGTQKTLQKGTLVVNENTASSAEFFKDVLRIRGWKIKGNKTYGKIATQYEFPSKFGNYLVTFGYYVAI